MRARNTSQGDRAADLAHRHAAIMSRVQRNQRQSGLHALIETGMRAMVTPRFPG